MQAVQGQQTVVNQLSRVILTGDVEYVCLAAKNLNNQSDDLVKPLTVILLTHDVIADVLLHDLTELCDRYS